MVDYINRLNNLRLFYNSDKKLIKSLGISKSYFYRMIRNNKFSKNIIKKINNRYYYIRKNYVVQVILKLKGGGKTKYIGSTLTEFDDTLIESIKKEQILNNLQSKLRKYESADNIIYRLSGFSIKKYRKNRFQ